MNSRPSCCSNPVSVIPAVCMLCGSHCGINVTFANGVPAKVEGRADHPLSPGYICPKGQAIAEIYNSKERLQVPLQKTTEGDWKQLSWAEAIGIWADRLQAIKKQYGAEAVAVHVGQAGVGKQFTSYVERFCHVFGTPNFSTSESHCHQSRVMASRMTCGFHPQPDFMNAGLIVLWGRNPRQSSPEAMQLIKQARLKGAKLMVIDPRAHGLARQADLHLQLRPGSDLALALGLLHVIIKEQLYDQDFVARWTKGFAELAAAVDKWSPEKAEQLTGVKADAVRQAARIYARSTPACITPGNAVELNIEGFQALRAITIIQAICGNLDIRGGAMATRHLPLTSLALKEKVPVLKKAVGQEEYPLFFKHSGQAQANLLAEAILSEHPYPIKAVVIAGSNPLLTWPNAGKIKEAFSKLELLVVIDNFMTETALKADMVLPAALFLAETEIWENSCFPGENRVGAAGKIVGNRACLTNWDLWKQLAEEMGYKEYFPWESEEKALDFRLKALGLSLSRLRQYPEGVVYDHWQEKKYEKQGFATPSGKVEIYSEELEAYGYSPLPAYDENEENQNSYPDEDYPLLLSSGARSMAFLHSRYRNIPSLRRLSPAPWLKINPSTAAAMGLNDGDQVFLESSQGRVAVRLKFTEELSGQVVYLLHGWREANVNILSDDRLLDPVTGFPACRAIRINIRKK